MAFCLGQEQSNPALEFVAHSIPGDDNRLCGGLLFLAGSGGLRSGLAGGHDAGLVGAGGVCRQEACQYQCGDEESFHGHLLSGPGQR